MTDQNKRAKKNMYDDDSAASPQEIHAQQVSIKSWAQKILVILLCVASFYAGWKSHESSVVNHCFASGGQMVQHDKTLICQI